jgi:hypothetical protein
MRFNFKALSACQKINRFIFKYKIYFLVLIPLLIFIWSNISGNKSTKNEPRINILNSENIQEILNKKDNSHYYLKKYENILKCNSKINLPQWTEESLKNKSESKKFDYFEPASNETHNDRIVRAVIIYFPIEKHKYFEHEFRWFYRSWIEMIKYEPAQWRTDLIVFTKNDNSLFKDNDFFFNQLKCSFENKRKSKFAKPMCTLIDYLPLKERKIQAYDNEIFKIEDGDKKLLKFLYLLEKIDIYNDDPTNLVPFYTLLQTKLSKYGYLDSILMAFDGYNYFKSAEYDFLIRSDMDVFLTPFFGLWTPKYCNDFIVGGGAYSENFNRKRLKKVAETLNLGYIGADNLGSTWYSTVEQFRLVSYLTLNMMMYISSEEFTKSEKEGKISFWPYWSHGVVLLYGQVCIY